MSATPFKVGDLALDEEAFRIFLHRFIDAGLGVYVGSGGSGEGHALTPAELKRTFEIAVEECRGKVAVHANPPEQHTPARTIEYARLAAEAKVDVIHMYTLAGWHGMKPTDAELIAYFDTVLAEIKHPIAIAVNPTMGYIPSAAVMVQICRKHRQIVTVKLTGVDDAYQLEMRDALGEATSFHVLVPNSITGVLLGADGVFGSEGNLMPRTYARLMQHYTRGELDETATVYAELRRLGQFVRKWGSSNPRWLKIGMKVLKLPGGEAGPRAPYALPPEADLQRYADGLLRLNIPEINEQAKAAGLL